MFEISDQGPLPSLAELVDAGPSSTTSDEDLARIGKMIADAELPIAATMGIGEGVRSIVDRLRGRSLLREYPEALCSLPWFECHAPPGGTTTVRASTSRSTEASGTVNLYGSGLGAGRRAVFTTSASSQPRTTCATYGLDCLVRTRVYDVRGIESVEADVVEVTGESIVSSPDCPFCGIAPTEIDPFDFRIGKHLDLRQDSVLRSQTDTISVEGTLSATIGLSLPLPISVTLGAKISRSTTLEVLSEFAPGSFYQAFTRLDMGPLQTSMWAVQTDEAQS